MSSPSSALTEHAYAESLRDGRSSGCAFGRMLGLVESEALERRLQFRVHFRHGLLIEEVMVPSGLSADLRGYRCDFV